MFDILNNILSVHVFEVNFRLEKKEVLHIKSNIKMFKFCVVDLIDISENIRKAKIDFYDKS